MSNRIRKVNINYNTIWVLCSCGCMDKLSLFDKRGRVMKYIPGHSGRGRIDSIQIRKNKSIARIGLRMGPMSEKHKNKISASLIGKNIWSFGNKFHYKDPEDRINSMNNSIRHSQKYKEWRIQVFGRDIFTCQECGGRGSWIEAHHIKSFANIIKKNNIKIIEDAIKCDELWNLNNGITLCKECHKKTNNYILE